MALLPLAVYRGVLPVAETALGINSTEIWTRLGLTAVGQSFVFALSFAVLRWEGVSLPRVGFSLTHGRWAVGWFAATVLVLNGLLLAVAIVVSDGYSVALAGVSPPVWIAVAVVNWGFVGIAEELGSRAYLQNKLHAMLDMGTDWMNEVGAIGIMAVLFAVWHIPQRLLIVGFEPSQLPGTLAMLFGIAVIFGTVYALTRNLVLTALLHDAWDFPPVFLSIQETETWQGIILLVAIGLPFMTIILLYHHFRRGVHYAASR